MARYRLLVPGEPVAKGRPQVYKGHGVTPARTRTAERRVADEFKKAYPDATPLDGPVCVDAEFWMSHQGRPDLDNLYKLVTDALNGLAYKDDSQIVDTCMCKITPDQLVPGARKGSLRKRKPGDQLTHHGIEYRPHTVVCISDMDPETGGDL
ncbi:RusA family crossover junction endodeoxyribonuclease [Bifidobacterium bombi]|uniref:Endodeoxyribonuclease RusA n=1 Tax=Bifidobacterium bombi DSM 19703 TaxID=1341695 RepID=A0A080N3Q0_9BIFI|nr:RusA family crossover junction endodeoxyribonuclease [Bifidobacterium bombi]KFF31671.1 endodeoxyribonuclease RusA [Bifidobacterium bombi DSM 19703]